MATRFYFSNAQAADISPAFGGWTNTSLAVRRALLSAKSDLESLANGSDHFLDSSSNPSLDRQFVSEPLAAQTINGSLKMQLRCFDFNALTTCTSRLLVRVVSGDGLTVRGTLLPLAQYGPNTAISQALLRNKTFADGDAISSVDAQAGDRIVIEIGFALLVGTDSGARADYGAPSGTSDLPENETETSAFVPWVEFSANLEFQIAGGVHSLSLLDAG